MNTKELDLILKNHKLWVESDFVKGNRADLMRANLSDADLSDADLMRANLSGADLSGADLMRANLSGVEGKRVLHFNHSSKHPLIYVDGFIRIGCQYHSVDEWLKVGKKLGTEAGYSKEEIAQYMNIVKFISKSKL